MSLYIFCSILQIVIRLVLKNGINNLGIPINAFILASLSLETIDIFTVIKDWNDYEIITLVLDRSVSKNEINTEKTGSNCH